jgi:SH3-like domain-containing protein
MKRGIIAAFALALAALAVGPATAQKERATPYWASIASGKAMMRTGPGRNYPGTWLYVRADLPVRVVETYPDWRKIEDPDGTRGWMLVKLLSDTRTAIVRGEGAQPMHAEPNESAPVRYRAEPGVVGRLEHCKGDWCELDVGGRQGFIRASNLWGLDPGETID